MPGWFNYSANGRPSRRGRSTPRQFVQSGGFVSVDLNVAGWTAVLLPGVILGAIVSMVGGAPLLLAMVLGALSTWMIAVFADRWKDRYREISVHYDWLSAENVEMALRRIRSRGITVAHVRVEVVPSSGQTFGPARDSHESVFRVQKRHYQTIDKIIVDEATVPALGSG